MKKILISVLIVLLLILTCFAIWKGIKAFNIKSIKDIKFESSVLDKRITIAENKATVDYSAEEKKLEEAINNLKLAKQEYENKKAANPEGEGIGALEVKTYKMHYLWTILGNYRKQELVRSINLDLKSTNAKDVYDLQFKLIGNYVSITDFLYDIEDDDELQFEVKNLLIKTATEKYATTNNTDSGTSNIISNSSSNSNTNTNTNTNTSTTSSSKKTTASGEDYTEGGTILEATFTVQNIGITLD